MAKKVPKLKVFYPVQQVTPGVHQIYLYDDIAEKGPFNWESWKYEDSETSAKYIQRILEQVPVNDRIEIYFNTNGGSVKEGIAIYNKLVRHGAHKVGYIDGVCHSVGLDILMACDERVAGEGTTALFHEAWEFTSGNADQLRHEADNLDNMNSAILRIFEKRTGQSRKNLQKMMKAETLLSAEQMLQYGFVDRIEGREVTLPEDAQNSMSDLRTQVTNAQDFTEELAELNQLLGEEKEPEENDPINLFLNAFLN